MIDLVGDDEHVLAKGQAVMDDHEDKVAEIMQRLQELLPEAKAALSVAHSTDPSYQLHRRLNDMERKLRLVEGKIDPLIPGFGLGSCCFLFTIGGAGRQYKVRPLGRNRRYSILWNGRGRSNGTET